MNKMPGTERPFSFLDFLNVLKKFAKEQNVEALDSLDYFDVLLIEGEKKLDTPDFYIVSKTAFGGCEGIYSDFYIVWNGKEERFATAKTLEESDDAFLAMSLMAAKVCLIANNYVKHHEDQFNWKGFDVRTERDGKLSPCGWWCPSLENAKARAAMQKKDCPDAKVFIRDNATRESSEFTS